jgi:hypothetical protein
MTEIIDIRNLVRISDKKGGFHKVKGKTDRHTAVYEADVNGQPRAFLAKNEATPGSNAAELAASITARFLSPNDDKEERFAKVFTINASLLAQARKPNQSVKETKEIKEEKIDDVYVASLFASSQDPSLEPMDLWKYVYTLYITDDRFKEARKQNHHEHLRVPEERPRFHGTGEPKAIFDAVMPFLFEQNPGLLQEFANIRVMSFINGNLDNHFGNIVLSFPKRGSKNDALPQRNLHLHSIDLAGGYDERYKEFNELVSPVSLTEPHRPKPTNHNDEYSRIFKVTEETAIACDNYLAMLQAKQKKISNEIAVQVVGRLSIAEAYAFLKKLEARSQTTVDYPANIRNYLDQKAKEAKEAEGAGEDATKTGSLFSSISSSEAPPPSRDAVTEAEVKEFLAQNIIQCKEAAFNNLVIPQLKKHAFSTRLSLCFKTRKENTNPAATGSTINKDKNTDLGFKVDLDQLSKLFMSQLAKGETFDTLKSWIGNSAFLGIGQSEYEEELKKIALEVLNKVYALHLPFPITQQSNIGPQLQKELTPSSVMGLTFTTSSQPRMERSISMATNQAAILSAKADVMRKLTELKNLGSQLNNSADNFIARLYHNKCREEAEIAKTPNPELAIEQYHAFSNRLAQDFETTRKLLKHNNQKTQFAVPLKIRLRNALLNAYGLDRNSSESARRRKMLGWPASGWPAWWITPPTLKSIEDAKENKIKALAKNEVYTGPSAGWLKAKRILTIGSRYFAKLLVCTVNVPYTLLQFSLAFLPAALTQVSLWMGGKSKQFFKTNWQFLMDQDRDPIVFPKSVGGLVAFISKPVINIAAYAVMGLASLVTTPLFFLTHQIGMRITSPVRSVKQSWESAQQFGQFVAGNNHPNIAKGIGWFVGALSVLTSVAVSAVGIAATGLVAAALAMPAIAGTALSSGLGTSIGAVIGSAFNTGGASVIGSFFSSAISAISSVGLAATGTLSTTIFSAWAGIGLAAKFAARSLDLLWSATAKCCGSAKVAPATSAHTGRPAWPNDNGKPHHITIGQSSVAAPASSRRPSISSSTAPVSSTSSVMTHSASLSSIVTTQSTSQLPGVMPILNNTGDEEDRMTEKRGPSSPKAIGANSTAIASLLATNGITNVAILNGNRDALANISSAPTSSPSTNGATVRVDSVSPVNDATINPPVTEDSTRQENSISDATSTTSLRRRSLSSSTVGV